jgi:initiation factor 1A
MVRGNVRGGKAYKKGKKGGNGGDREEGGGKFVGREDGQDYARALKILGNRRVLCFCNDGVERVGKIRGGLCKGPNKKRIEEGDIMIVSHRSFDTPSSDDESEEGDEDSPISIKKPASTPVPESGAILASGRKDVVDILDKVGATHWRSVRKEKGIHRYLFPNSSGDDGVGEDIFEEEPVKKSTENNDVDTDEEVDVDAI